MVQVTNPSACDLVASYHYMHLSSSLSSLLVIAHTPSLASLCKGLVLYVQC